MPANTKEPHIAFFNLKIDGSQASEEVMAAMLECTVENSLHLPDAASIRIHDAGFKWLDSNIFAEGKTLVIEAGDEKNKLTKIFQGEIVGLDLDLSGQAVTTIVVRSLNRAHRLHRGRYNRSFIQVKDSDIVSRIAGEVGLTPDTDATSTVHDCVFQDNQTNWEFLSERAERNGYRLYVNENKLHFNKINDSDNNAVNLEWGTQLRSFRPRVSTVGQVDSVEVRGWDPKKKETITAECKSANGVAKIGGEQQGGTVAKKAFSSAKMVVVEKPIASVQEAETVAQSVMDSISDSFVEAEGLCYGNNKLLPGIYAEIKNIGDRFSGKYYITSTTHTYTAAEGYTTTFSATGKQPPTVLSLLGRSDGIGRSRMGNNILVGIVTDNKDPDKMGRVKVKFPTLTNDHTSWWARITSMMAGKDRGWYILPEIDDEVLVAFEHGDINRPYIIGSLWNGKDTLPETEVLGSGGVDRRVFYTRIGHKMWFDDKDGKGDITLKTKGEHIVVMDDTNKKVMVKTTNGHEVTLDDSGSKIVVKNSSGDQVEMTDSGVISVKANQTINLDAVNININAKVGLKLSGVNVEMSGSGQVKVGNGGMVDITAGMVKINS